ANGAVFPAHRDRHLRFASIGLERADRDLALLQLREGDAAAGAAASPEPGSGRARLLADLPFGPSSSPLGSPHPRAHPEISVDRGLCRVAPKSEVRDQRLADTGSDKR